MARVRIIVLLSLLFPALCATDAYAAPFDEIVVFGDSLSDNGNLVFFEGQPAPDPDLYWQGRLSNGPVWVEYLAGSDLLDAPLKNRAFGGAETRSLIPPGLVEQLILHALDDDPPFSPDTLFIVWIGGNDYLNSDRLAQDVVNDIESVLNDLARFGARHLLVLNLPDLGVIPENINSPDAAPATAFTLEYNAALGSMLDRFSTAHPAVALYEFDAYGLSLAVANNPAAFGFLDATQPSPNFEEAGNFDGGGSVFWDDKHPTTQMHALLADRVYASLNEQMAGPGEAESAGSSSCFIGASRWGI